MQFIYHIPVRLLPIDPRDLDIIANEVIPVGVSNKLARLSKVSFMIAQLYGVLKHIEHTSATLDS